MASYLPADCWLAIPLGCVFTAKGISSTRRAAAMPQQVFVDDGAMNCFSKWLAACPPVKFSVAVESTNVQSISGQLKLLHAPGSDTYRLVGRDKKTVSTWASYFEWKNWGKLDGYPKTLLRRLVNIMGSYQFQLSASTCSRGLARSCAAKVSRISGAAAADLLHKISLPHASASCCRAFACTAGPRRQSKTASPRKEALWRYIRYLHLLNQLPATPNFLLRKKKVSCGASMCCTHFRPVKTSTNPWLVFGSRDSGNLGKLLAWRKGREKAFRSYTAPWQQLMEQKNSSQTQLVTCIVACGKHARTQVT